MLILDRFEGDIAVIENDGEMIEAERENIASDAVEGDILVETEGIYYPDKEETQKRREKLTRLQNELWG